MFEINKLGPIRNEAKSKGLDDTIILALKVKDVHKYLHIGYRFAVIFNGPLTKLGYLQLSNEFSRCFPSCEKQHIFLQFSSKQYIGQ